MAFLSPLLFDNPFPINISLCISAATTSINPPSSSETLNAIDALISGFPAGTVSGAPKIRAMEIIEELENVSRSFYGGAMGYFDSNGDMDTCISLRTGLVKDKKLYIQAGGGIVYDSDPEKEYQETINKANALVVAAEDSYKYE